MENEDIERLVIARLDTLPSDREISIGSEGSFNKEELIRHVKDGDAIGRKMIEVELGFLRSLKESAFYE